jgi:competence protein ComGC
MSTRIRRRVKQENGVTMSMILISAIFMILILLLTLPNIYLDNQIYYESRDIAHYQSIAQTLREEQTIIKYKLKDIKYRENVLMKETE